MSADLIPLIAAGVLLLLGLTTLKAGELRRQRSQLVTYRLQFPRQLEVQAATNFLAGLSGLLLPWWRRWLSSPFVVLEVSARKAGVTHQVVVPAIWSRAVEKWLQASAPAIRFERIEGTLPLPTTAAEYRLTSDQRPLRVDARDLALKLLANLQPLRRHEAITVQWVVTPSGPVAPARVTTSEERAWLSISAEPELDVESAAALRKKQSAALLLAVARIGVSSPSPARRRLLLRHAEMAWHGARAPGVHMERRWLPSSVVARRIGHRVVPLAIWPGVYNVEELTGLIGWPLEVAAAPGIVLGGSRQIPPSPQVPRTGTVIGESTYPGSPRPIALDLQARLRHLHVLGPTGTGKSNLLTTIATQDMEAGHGVIVLDAKGDLADDLLARVPAKRRADVIVLDPADDSRPVGLNPLRAAAGVSAEVVVENLVGTFKSLYRTSWGPRTDDIFRAALLTLAQTGDATLPSGRFSPATRFRTRYRSALGPLRVGRARVSPLLLYRAVQLMDLDRHWIRICLGNLGRVLNRLLLGVAPGHDLSSGLADPAIVLLHHVDALHGSLRARSERGAARRALARSRSYVRVGFDGKGLRLGGASIVRRYRGR